MKISREQLAARSQQRITERKRARSASRNAELIFLVAASVVVATGLQLAYLAKTYDSASEQRSTLNLNELTGPQELLPYLGIIAAPSDQEFIANRIYELKRHGAVFSNVGAIARIRVTEREISNARGLISFRERLAEARRIREQRQGSQDRSSWLRERASGHKQAAETAIPLLRSLEFASLKPHLRVRNHDDFRRQFLIWGLPFFAAFYLPHSIWRLRGFRCDNLILPVMHALCGIGLMLMISLRDPLRDTLVFTDFTQGVIAGSAALLLFSIPDYRQQFSRLSYVPLLAALVLAVALGLFGTGPAGSDAKVNLFFFQPVELIRILIVFFLAGYFAQNWDALRFLKQQQGSPASRGWNVPRLDYVLPVVAGVAVSVALFFWLSDLGPALVIGCLFLSMYSMARKRVLLAATGLAAIVSAFVIGYATGYPHTVRERVEMWKSPWNNHIRGGDQLADSLWALSTGGATGTGLGLGDPQSLPAGHTDLVISAFGEEAGFLGIVALYSLYAVLIYRSLRIAVRASTAYSFFLVAGLTLITAYQLMLITGGLLGLIPLSGVVSPFLSYGRTSMVANFILFAIILSISSENDHKNRESAFIAASRRIGGLLAVLGIVLIARFFWVQVAKADEILIRPSLIMQADGVRRYEYNPRLLEVARSLPKGAILDRTGIPLATSDWSQIEAHRGDYQRLGVTLERTTSQSERRYYPLGAPAFYLLGDVRSRLKQGATNTAFQENASRIRLQGYDDVAEVEESRDPETGEITSRIRRDYRALIPLVRHRYEPDNPAVKELRTRPRDVRMSVSAALQMRASEILSRDLLKLGKQKGALVVMDPSTGDMLAAVSYPWPSQTQLAALEANPETALPQSDLLDRARFGLYPPGSAFKIVTSIAALRKDPALARQRYECIRLPGGRVGNFVWKREIRDDIKDTQPHGSVDLQKGLIVSCNAYFAQLGAHRVGSQMLYDTASKLGISVAQPNTPKKLQEFLPQASYGQGQVVASPFQMARVAATIANGGSTPQGRWIIDETNPRVRPLQPLLSPSLADQVAAYMRGVVSSGTARVLKNSPIPIAGKTGTAELANAPSHAWFIGFAPYKATNGKQIAFAVLVENGQYGGTAAAPIAGEIVAAARELGII
jgi:cell division protein FtsI/penicillin-binding protein 2/cell division protein FtsW (lipid II flippase)